MPERLLEGKTVVVTGGSMGIGYVCAEEIVSAGGAVVICARGERDLDSARDRLARLPGAVVHGVRADVTAQRDLDCVLDAAVGVPGHALHGVVHCAGIYGPIGPAVAVDPEAWLEAIRVNLFGTFLVARSVCRRLIDSGVRGSLVLLSGGGAATPFPNYTAYACAKVGVVRFTETLAQETAEYGIRVNCVAPGLVATRLHDQTLAAGDARAGKSFHEKTKAELARGGVPASVAARAAVFLLSERAAQITGRFLAAPYDSWDAWPDHANQFAGSDLFTLRRIVPRDRGMDWQ
ncbi:MAG TPA: SDR family oxidoreductase [Gemmatimonadales bacterium]|nr:SDR family oxidoreductase [Gemmatimonadales bacterium]